MNRDAMRRDAMSRDKEKRETARRMERRIKYFFRSIRRSRGTGHVLLVTIHRSRRTGHAPPASDGVHAHHARAHA